MVNAMNPPGTANPDPENIPRRKTFQLPLGPTLIRDQGNTPMRLYDYMLQKINILCAVSAPDAHDIIPNYYLTIRFFTSPK